MNSLARIPGLADIETPAYVYDLDEVRRCRQALRSALPQRSRLFYSVKANPHPAIVGLLGARGCGAEVSSPGELSTALRAGVPASDVLYTGPGKRDQDLAEAVRAGVTLHSVDSPRALDQMAAVAAGLGTPVRYLLRVNDQVPAVGQGLTMTGVASQFGADADWVAAEPARFRSRPFARFAGFHLYMGSNITDVQSLLRQFGTAVATAARLARLLREELELVNLGGGFGAPFARAGTLPPLVNLATALGDMLDAAFPRWRAGKPAIAFESGRYLTATCGSLLTRVLDVKRSHGRVVVILESGIHHLGGMAGLRRLPPLVPDLDMVAPAAADERHPGDVMITGPLCTPLDTWAKGISFPCVRPGDVLRVPNVGAYGLSASLVAFLGHPLPREVVVDRGRITEISQLTLVRRDVRFEGGTRS